MPEAREVVVERRLDDVIDVGDLPLQIRVSPDVALERNVVHLMGPDGYKQNHTSIFRKTT